MRAGKDEPLCTQELPRPGGCPFMPPGVSPRLWERPGARYDGRMTSLLPRVLIVSSDLFFSSQLRSATERAGAAADIVMDAAQAASRAQSDRFDALIIDLEAPGLNLKPLLGSLPIEGRPRVIAFGPHVQEQRLEAARAAGCDQVVSRGQIARGLPELLSSIR